MPYCFFTWSICAWRSGQADDRRIEQVGILADLLGSVVRRVDGDEDDVVAVGTANLLAKLDHPRQRCRAHVAAAREAEIDDVGFAEQLVARERLSVGSNQRERPAEGRLRGRRAMIYRSERPRHDQQGGGPCGGQCHKQPHHQPDLLHLRSGRGFLGHGSRMPLEQPRVKASIGRIWHMLCSMKAHDSASV